MVSSWSPTGPLPWLAPTAQRRRSTTGIAGRLDAMILLSRSRARVTQVRDRPNDSEEDAREQQRCQCLESLSAGIGTSRDSVAIAAPLMRLAPTVHANARSAQPRCVLTSSVNHATDQALLEPLMVLPAIASAPQRAIRFRHGKTPESSLGLVCVRFPGLRLALREVPILRAGRCSTYSRSPARRTFGVQ